jgi:hypothetical protein
MVPPFYFENMSFAVEAPADFYNYFLKCYFHHFIIDHIYIDEKVLFVFIFD